MTAKGHMLLASAAVFGVQEILHIDDFKIFYVGTLIGSVLPDIDESESWIGKKLGTISEITSLILPHRTLTHYLIVPLLIAALAFWQQSTFLYGLAFGILLHDIGDMLTKGGIKGFFFPFMIEKKIALLPYSLRFYTNSIQEHFLMMFLLMVNLYFMMNYLLKEGLL